MKNVVSSSILCYRQKPGAKTRAGNNSLKLAALTSLTATLALLPVLWQNVPGTELRAQEPGNTKVENISQANWAGQDYAPQITPDGRYLIFQSNRPGSMSGHNLWISENRRNMDRMGSGEWTVPLPMALPLNGKPTKSMKVNGGLFSVNTDGFEGMASFVYRNKRPVEFYFTSRKKAGVRDGYDGLNIYYAAFSDGRWWGPWHINEINTHFNDRMPCVTQDGLRMYLVSDRPGGLGGSDVWISHRNRKDLRRWSRPVNLGPAVNSGYNEVAPCLSPGKKYLFFSSDRPGGFGHYDFYYARRDGESFKQTRNMGVPFNSPRDDEYLSVTKDRLWAYISSDRRAPRARGRFDLYRLPMPDWLHESMGVLFTGQILDGKTRLPLGVAATIRITYEKGEFMVRSRVVNKKQPNKNWTNFKQELDSGRIYKVTVKAPGFEPASLVLNYKGSVPAGAVDRRKILLQPIKNIGPRKGANRVVDGRVTDAETGRGIAGAYVDFFATGRPGRTVRADANGRFRIKVPVGEIFEVTGRAGGYSSRSRRFRESPKLKVIDIPLTKIPRNPCVRNLPACLDKIKIQFALGKWEVGPSELPKLDKIVKILSDFPDVIIRVAGHADVTYNGPQNNKARFNLRLSRRRAEVVKQALIKRGIPAGRLKPQGNSYLKPLCTAKTAACYQRNRRVEFIRVPGKAGDNSSN